jgi:hypothetical protein
LADVAFGFFYSLFIVSFLRGLILRFKAMRDQPKVGDESRLFGG